MILINLKQDIRISFKTRPHLINPNLVRQSFIPLLILPSYLNNQNSIFSIFLNEEKSRSKNHEATR